MSELERITIKGFKSIRDVESLVLGPINILVGANGSGKSNFISVFSFLRELREGRLQDYVRRSGGAERILHLGSKVTEEVEVLLVFNEERNQYKISLSVTDTNELYPESEVAYFWDKRSHPRPYSQIMHPNGHEAGISGEVLGGVATYVKNHLDRWRVYHFHDTSSSSPLKKTSRVADNRFLRADGSNISSFLYLLKEKYPDSYSIIKGALQRVFPPFSDFNLRPNELNDDFIGLEWKHKNSDDYFDVSSFSDGTLRFLALATLFLQPVSLRPSVILVDEPELGLHPYAIGMLASLIKQASIETQVILSTQSPFLLDHFEPSDVIVSNLKNGATELSRLDVSALADWLEEYSLGQLWEKNEIGGRPLGGG
jgi:predicted ATPase